MWKGRPFKCPYCGTSGSTIGKGVRKTKTLGIRRIRRCKDCGRKFTPRNQRQVEQGSGSTSDPQPAADLTGKEEPIHEVRPSEDHRPSG